MAYDDEQARRSRVVVETPTSRREVTQTEAVRNDRGGVSGATVGVIVVVAIALITILVLFLMNGQSPDTRMRTWQSSSNRRSSRLLFSSPPSSNSRR